MASKEDLLSPQQAAERLGVSLSRIHQFCQDGRLGQRVGGVWIIADSDLREFAKMPRQPGRPAEKNTQNRAG